MWKMSAIKNCKIDNFIILLKRAIMFVREWRFVKDHIHLFDLGYLKNFKYVFYSDIKKNFTNIISIKIFQNWFLKDLNN